jgi:hypothetical protein
MRNIGPPGCPSMSGICSSNYSRNLFGTGCNSREKAQAQSGARNEKT